MAAATIYKLLTRGEWEAARAEGVYRGSAHDARDGYIHFSTAAQLGETARKYFAGVARSGSACGGCWGAERARSPHPVPLPLGEGTLNSARACDTVSSPLGGDARMASCHTVPSPRGEGQGEGSELRWESARGGDLFPHLYCDLPLAAVKTATAIPLGRGRRSHPSRRA